MLKQDSKNKGMETKQVVPIDPMSLSTKARRRMRTSREETAILEDFYNKNPNPSNDEKAEIANTVKMGPRNVHFWFQNRRAKDNKRRKMIRLRQQAQQQCPNGQFTYQELPNVTKGKDKLNLPPISAFMSSPQQQQQQQQQQRWSGLSVPFYFHHAKFGIADCMVQWSKGNEDPY